MKEFFAKERFRKQMMEIVPKNVMEEIEGESGIKGYRLNDDWFSDARLPKYHPTSLLPSESSELTFQPQQHEQSSGGMGGELTVKMSSAYYESTQPSKHLVKEKLRSSGGREKGRQDEDISDDDQDKNDNSAHRINLANYLLTTEEKLEEQSSYLEQPENAHSKQLSNFPTKKGPLINPGNFRLENGFFKQKESLKRPQTAANTKTFSISKPHQRRFNVPDFASRQLQQHKTLELSGGNEHAVGPHHRRCNSSSYLKNNKSFKRTASQNASATNLHVKGDKPGRQASAEKTLPHYATQLDSRPRPSTSHPQSLHRPLPLHEVREVSDHPECLDSLSEYQQVSSQCSRGGRDGIWGRGIRDID